MVNILLELFIRLRTRARSNEISVWCMNARGIEMALKERGWRETNVIKTKIRIRSDNVAFAEHVKIKCF